MTEYLFGKSGNKHLALNHIILELKKTIFYANKSLLESPNFKEIFIEQIRNLMLKEKIISNRKKKFDNFEEKWNNFIHIYDFRGPDKQLTF